MYQNKKQHENERQLTDNTKLGYYELALYLAATKAKEEEFHWENFIDNLSYICDKYATQIKTNNVKNI